MVRLIDADALIGKTIIGGRRNNKTIIRYIVTNIVQNEPTVDAVPVEWIEKYIDENPLYQADDFHWYIQDMIHDWMEKRKEE